MTNVIVRKSFTPAEFPGYGQLSQIGKDIITRIECQCEDQWTSYCKRAVDVDQIDILPIFIRPDGTTTRVGLIGLGNKDLMSHALTTAAASGEYSAVIMLMEAWAGPESCNEPRTSPDRRDIIFMSVCLNVWGKPEHLTRVCNVDCSVSPRTLSEDLGLERAEQWHAIRFDFDCSKLIPIE